MTEEEKTVEDRRSHFVWEEGDLEYLGNFPQDTPAEDDDDEEEADKPTS